MLIQNLYFKDTYTYAYTKGLFDDDQSQEAILS